MTEPFTRACRYYAESRQSYLDHQSGGLPLARPTISLAAQALRDEVVLSGLRWRRRLSNPRAFRRITEEVIDALKLYERQGWLNQPEAFFAAPPPLTDVTVRPVKHRRGWYERIVFDSGYAPYPGEPGRDRWLSYTANSRGYALMLRHHHEPRSWVACIHGTEMGRGALDITLFRAWQLHDELGLNVLLPVLPMHGPRSRRLPEGAVFPGEDVLDDVHATAQAVWDIRRLLSWIRLQAPNSPMGLNSMSLGGYIAALVASLDDGLACTILGVPVADLIQLLARHAGLSPDDPRLV